MKHAPVLQTESLGEPARGVNVWERWMVPNPDGKSWDVLQLYFKEYYGPTGEVQDTERRRRNREEVAGGDVGNVIGQEGSPGLGRQFTSLRRSPFGIS